MYLFCFGVALLFSIPLLLVSWVTWVHLYMRIRYLHVLARIFQEKPLFIVPRGQPLPHAEPVKFPTSDGLSLNGIYLKGKKPRRGVILFGLEFGSDCWSCWSYCEHLVEAGFDVFAFEFRNQGGSDTMPGYDPLQWVTDYEVSDTRAALNYLRGRPDADPRGVGFFGISKGAGAGLLAGVADPWVRCFVTDGVFATYSTVVPYMRQWFRIYNTHVLVQGVFPDWFFGMIGLAGLKRTERDRNCHFPHLERALPRLAPRPIFMIHGGADTYIKASMARDLFARARGLKELWIVEGAKHNQALHVAGEDYRSRVLEFFEAHLVAVPVSESSSSSARQADQGQEPAGFPPDTPRVAQAGVHVECGSPS